MLGVSHAPANQSWFMASKRIGPVSSGGTELLFLEKGINLEPDRSFNSNFVDTHILPASPTAIPRMSAFAYATADTCISLVMSSHCTMDDTGSFVTYASLAFYDRDRGTSKDPEI